MLNLVLRPQYVRVQLCLRSRGFTTCALRSARHLISEGKTTNFDDETKAPEQEEKIKSKSPFYFETGYSIFAKRPSRPFPPPFVSRPSGSFSDPLTTHNHARGRRPSVNGQLIRGITNGDDAIVINGQNFLAVDDGVGAWAQKDRGHAALWSRLIAHFWAVEVENSLSESLKNDNPITLEQIDLIKNLQTAYDQTKAVTSEANEILGTTTASSAFLHCRDPASPVVLATTLGDCAIHVVRPSTSETIYRTKEQWHWFDCPRQLGTNSPDTPLNNAVTDTVDVHVGDIVVVMSDGVTDNLWEEEIATKVSEAMKKWEDGDPEATDGVVYVARTLMNAAREVAQDPNAESPYMERALDEGIAAEGGKLDDISVVIGVCRKRE